MNAATADDAAWMTRCLALARQGRGHTHPNPMVGCVVLDAQGQLVAEGYHAGYGQPHAEAMALSLAGEKARGGTLYVNLEPCNHTGRTPPCTEAILAAGIQTVIYGMGDPNPHVTGGGGAYLASRGLTVRHGVLHDECQVLNEAFVHRVKTGQPFVVLKQAMTLDGRIATRRGDSQWITSPEARGWVHQLRADSDAILTTAETVIADNARLTVRGIAGPVRPPVRVVLDRQGRLDPSQLALFAADEAGEPVWVITASGNRERPAFVAMARAGAQVFEVPVDPDGLDLAAVMTLLGEQRLTQVLVEAGGLLAGSLMRHRMVHKLWLAYGGLLLMDPSAKPGFVGPPVQRLTDAVPLRLAESQQLGNTWVLAAYPQY